MKSFIVETRERTQFVDITREVVKAAAGLLPRGHGVLTVFIPHTTAGITINENADPNLIRDMKKSLDKMVPWEDDYLHGEGNSAAHIKASLMGSSIRVVAENNRLQLGTWQSIYLCEFDGPRTRNVWVSI